MQFNDLNGLHGHDKGWNEWTTNAIRWTGMATWPFEGLYGTSMQFDGLDGLHGHDKV